MNVPANTIRTFTFIREVALVPAARRPRAALEGRFASAPLLHFCCQTHCSHHHTFSGLHHRPSLAFVPGVPSSSYLRIMIHPLERDVLVYLGLYGRTPTFPWLLLSSRPTATCIRDLAGCPVHMCAYSLRLSISTSVQFFENLFDDEVLESIARNALESPSTCPPPSQRSLSPLSLPALLLLASRASITNRPSPPRASSSQYPCH
ncbi:hypothetical protein C8R45DRAFT_1186743 [Mycena sanguinolenta]|nr:hypothetical protein C8R45DRAFT_1186743 [Mycena sanguinolenta]